MSATLYLTRKQNSHCSPATIKLLLESQATSLDHKIPFTGPVMIIARRSQPLYALAQASHTDTTPAESAA